MGNNLEARTVRPYQDFPVGQKDTRIRVVVQTGSVSVKVNKTPDGLVMEEISRWGSPLNSHIKKLTLTPGSASASSKGCGDVARFELRPLVP